MIYPVTCSVGGCSGSTLTSVGGCKGLCCRHYTRLKRHGNPVAGRIFLNEIDDWVKALIERNPSDCVAWPFAKTTTGYGKVCRSDKHMLASRFVCLLAKGEPSEPRLEAAHSCGNGHLACVTPAHLSWKTIAENEADKRIHGTAMIGERHCFARLREAEVREIILSADKPAVLSQRYGISKGHIYQIRTRKAWSHLDLEGAAA